MKNLFYLLIGLLVFASCKTTEKDSNKPFVVCTTGMIADAVKAVAGEDAEVTALMGPGVDPHLYKATQGDLELLTKADIIFYNGLHLEGKMGEVLKKLSRIKSVVAISEEVPKEKLFRVPEFDNNYDPHIWFDLSLWKYSLPVIEKELSKMIKEKEEMFKQRSNDYINDLDSLHEWAINEINTIPDSSRVLITAHDAFGYFGKAYGMEVKGLQGISTLSEFGLRDRINLIDLITERQIKAVFLETSVSERSIKAVVEGCEERGFSVNIGGYLYSDAMGQQGTPEGTFKGMFTANVETITKALR